MYEVLIVDDERAEREGLAQLLKSRSEPFSITLQENGASALELLRSRRFDILVSDIVMPMVDGLSLCAEARSLWPDIVTIISSAYSDFKYTQAAIRIGVDDYVLKPVVIDSFNSTIDRVIELAQSRPCQEFPLTDNPFDEGEDRLIPEVKALIQAHFHEDIGLEWISQQVYLSPGYLSSLFKRKTNRTVMQYITLCRMRRACYLLTKTNMKIVQICQETGYQNPSYFCFLFKKCFDITPNQLRRGVTPDVMAKIQAIME